ncbi:MAG: SurA N-terminal domain-containing protein, partial [Paludibacteraceae bacterium]|nr:SurA N-terminal domain-containing protein [Paludibacteraceae bacterium]
MALLETIRQKKIFLFVVIGVAMLMFVIGDVNWQSLFGQSPTEVDKIEGEELDYMDYERRVAEMTAFYEVQYGSDAQMQEQIRSQVWNAFVYETLVAKQCDKLGLQVSDEELTSRLTGDNPHPALAQMRLFYNPDKGGFDPDMLQNMLGIISDYENNGNAQYNAEYVEKLKNCWGFIEHYIRT